MGTTVSASTASCTDADLDRMVKFNVPKASRSKVAAELFPLTKICRGDANTPACPFAASCLKDNFAQKQSVQTVQVFGGMIHANNKLSVETDADQAWLDSITPVSTRPALDALYLRAIDASTNLELAAGYR